MKNGKLIWMFLMLLLIISCGKDKDLDPIGNGNPIGNGDPIGNGNPTDRCEDINSTLTNNVLPIINNNCAISGCHISGGQFPDFSVRSNIIANALLIRTQTESGNMPAQGSGLTLTPQQKDLIFCWVSGGALDN